jgi:hypothetical protein
MASALGDASWLLGLERNSDLVTMSSYAPLWVNVNGSQWVPDLIGFNNTTSYGSPSYYAQVMLSQNHGTTVVSDTVTGASGLQTLVTRTGTTYYLTVINTLGTDNTATVNLSGASAVAPMGSMTTLIASSSAATNSIANPTNIVPATSSITGLGSSFSHTFPSNSITVLKFTASAQPVTAAATFEFETQQRLVINFSSDVGDTIDASDVQVIDQVTDLPVATNGFSYDPIANRATVGFSPAILPSGSYQLSITSGPSSGLTGPYTFNFFMLAGDANRDGVVNTADFTSLALNFNRDGMTWSDGDFNYDGKVNALDFNALATEYGYVVASPAVPTTAPLARAPAIGSLFSTKPMASVTGDVLAESAPG